MLNTKLEINKSSLKTKKEKNMKNIFVVLSVLLVVMLSSCETTLTEDMEPINSENEITFTMSGADKGNLKSATTVDNKIQHGDTIDIKDSRYINYVFTAYNQADELADGYFTISLVDHDLKMAIDTYLKKSLNNIVQGPIASLRASELGLYRINFIQPVTNKQVWFYIRHTGLPGQIGDGADNVHAFRLSKKEHYMPAQMEPKVAYHCFLKASDEEIKEKLSMSEESEIKAILFHQNGRAKFEVKKCKYSEYILFSFFVDEYKMTNHNVYDLVFYVGEYGLAWFSFNSSYKSSWTKGKLPSSILSFSDFN